MQAIRTRFLGPTNTRPARMVAECQARRIVVPYDHATSVPENHRFAARQLILRQEWAGEWIAGDLPDGSTVWVNLTWAADHPSEWTAVGQGFEPRI